MKGSIETAEAEAKDQDAIEASLRGMLQGQDLSLNFTGASPLAFREEGRPYPIDLNVISGETKVSVSGQMQEPVKLQGLDLDIALEGPSLANLFPLLAIPLPKTPAYSLTAQLTRTKGVWRAENIQGAVGNSDLRGSASLDHRDERPFLKADLVSERLVLDDLRALIWGTTPAENGAKAGRQQEGTSQDESKIFPDAPLADERLHAMNMDVTFEGKQVVAEAVPIDAVSTRIQLTDGRLLARPLIVTVADGQASGELALNAREEVPSADMQLTFQDVRLTPFFEGAEFVQEMGGRFSGEISVLGVGQSLHKMMVTARGEGWLVMRDGSISALLVEAAALDLAEALVLVADSDARIGIRCGRVGFEASNGIVSAKRVVIDTADSILVAQGSANLPSQTLDLQIEARAKGLSVIDASAPVSVTGKFDDPSISIGELDLLPFLEMGDAQDLSCEKLLSGAPQSGEDFDGSSSD